MEYLRRDGHFDHTRAVEPLERNAEWALGEVEESFPTGI